MAYDSDIQTKPTRPRSIPAQEAQRPGIGLWAPMIALTVLAALALFATLYFSPSSGERTSLSTGPAIPDIVMPRAPPPTPTVPN